MENARIFTHRAISACHEFSSFFSLVQFDWFVTIYTIVQDCKGTLCKKLNNDKVA